jgi:hypothetical protein
MTHQLTKRSTDESFFYLIRLKQAYLTILTSLVFPEIYPLATL